MNNPKIVAIISAVAAIWLGSDIFIGGNEAPSPAVNLMNWVFFLAALVACVGSLYQIAKGGRKDRPS